jgi:hypothetical protein
VSGLYDDTDEQLGDALVKLEQLKEFATARPLPLSVRGPQERRGYRLAQRVALNILKEKGD